MSPYPYVAGSAGELTVNKTIVAQTKLNVDFFVLIQLNANLPHTGMTGSDFSIFLLGCFLLKAFTVPSTAWLLL